MRGTIHNSVDRIVVTALARQNRFAKRGLGTGYTTPKEPDSEKVTDDILRNIAGQLRTLFPDAADVLRFETED